jgi:hypothetical protein
MLQCLASPITLTRHGYLKQDARSGLQWVTA